jgi:hypothetical protein
MDVNSNLLGAHLESRTKTDIAGFTPALGRVLYDASGNVIRIGDGSRFRNSSDLELRTTAELATDAKYLGATRYDSTLNSLVVWNGSAWVASNSSLPTIAQLDMDFYAVASSSREKIQSITFIGRPILLMPSKSIGTHSALFGPYLSLQGTTGLGSGTISIKYKISIIIDGVNYEQYFRSMSGYLSTTDTTRTIMFDIPTTIIESTVGTKNVNVLFELVDVYIGGTALSKDYLTHACVGSMKFIQL